MSKVLIGVGIFAAIVAIIAVQAWAVMLVLGALGHVFDADWLFLSFWESVVVTLALGVIGSFFKGTTR